jgi:tetratricopeptide (TPR) repeat protein
LALGDLFRDRKDYGGAAAAYDEVGQVSQPDPELLQKAELGAGEMYDLLKKRDLAIKRYQAAIGPGGSAALTQTARERIQEPYHGQP